jgi:allantoinase
MERAAALGLPVAVHAESEELTAGKTAWMHATLPRLTVKEWPYTREVLAEKDAIQRAILIASTVGCSLHIVHISNGSCIDLATSYKPKLGERPKIDLSIETCPHYYLLSHADVEKLGPVAKCAPPIRARPADDQVWHRVVTGIVDIVGSDHSPSPLQMKAADFFAAWGGVAGVQSTLSSLLTREPHIQPERAAIVTATNVADRFRVRQKGRVDVDSDADVALVDMGSSYTLTRDMLLDRHKLSPYVGRTFRGVVKRTIVRGHTVFQDGKIVVGDFRGRLIKPERRKAGAA